MTPLQRQIHGYTLIELLLAVAVVGTLGLFASSVAGSAVHAARATDATSRLLASLTQARTTAAVYGADVVLCPSSDGSQCADDYHWESGWIAFVDKTGDSERAGDEPLLLTEKALSERVHLITSAGRTRIRFQPNGSNAGSNATFTLCDGRGKAKATALVMANNGNLRRADPTPERVAEACAH